MKSAACFIDKQKEKKVRETQNEWQSFSMQNKSSHTKKGAINIADSIFLLQNPSTTDKIDTKYRVAIAIVTLEPLKSLSAKNYTESQNQRISRAKKEVKQGQKTASFPRIGSIMLILQYISLSTVFLE